MPELRTEIIIDATPEKVWSLLMDFDNYPQWNPFIRSVQGPAKQGEKIRVTLRMENGKEMKFNPRVLRADENQRFEWLGHLFIPGLFDGNHYFIVEKLKDHQVKFIHGETFKGILSGVVLKKIGEETKRGFEKMNSVLKTLAEKE